MFYVNLTAVELVGTSGGSGAGPSIKKPGDVVQVTILENDNARGTVQFDVSTADPITANILDYFPSSGTVSFADGQQTADIIITIVDDQLAEAMEVQIREPVSTGDAQGQAQLRVQRVQGTEGLVNVQWRLSAEAQDDFVPPLEGTLSFNPVEGSVTFLDLQQTATITLQVQTMVRRNKGLVGQVQVYYTTSDGTATSGQDYFPNAGVLVFENGVDAKVQEEAGVAQIPVIRRQGSYGAVNVSYATQPITASSGVDYLPASDTLRLEDGQSEAVINVTLQDDSDPEFAEQFSITLSNPRED
nr:hypothetical protein BaRGS_033772 [Batillaria attramentaria]